MSHLFRYYKDGVLVAASTPGAVRMREPPHAAGQVGTFAGDPNYGGSQSIEFEEGARVVLEPVVVAETVFQDPDDMFQGTIVDAVIASPTALLVGHETAGGWGQPWSIGPADMHSIYHAQGSMLFCIGNSVAIVIGVGGSGSLLQQVKTNYLRRGVYLKVHTGIGSVRRRVDGDTPEGPTFGPFPGGQRALPEGAPKPRIFVPDVGWVDVPSSDQTFEEHPPGVHQHPGTSFLDRWKEDFGALWDGLSEFPGWLSW